MRSFLCLLLKFYAAASAEKYINVAILHQVIMIKMP